MDLGDLNFDAVSDIISSLSDSDMENLSKMASQMFSSGDKKDGGNQKDNSQSPFGDMPFDMESITKVMSLMKKLQNQPEDPRVKLLFALKPMLTKNRQHKVDQAVQMMRIMAILPLLKE